MRKSYYYVSIGLARITPYALLVKARNIVEKMTGNPAFPTPSTPLADVTAGADALEAAIHAYGLNPGPRERSDRAQAFDQLKALLTAISGYVQSASNGDQHLIETAGMGVRRSGSPIGELAPPQNVRAKVTAYPGRVDLVWGAVRGRRLYRVSRTAADPKDESSWEEVGYTSSNRMSMTDLASDTTYYFRVEAVGTAGMSPASDVAKAKAA